jgi:pyrroloquinoline quinone biosynthesis protein B
LPQWNCACANCRLARQGKIPPLTQSSVAIHNDGGEWFLINASPDLRAQISASPELQPDSAALRNSPISTVLLTNADLDHVAGLLLMREGGKLHVHATKTVCETLTESLGFVTVLDAFCGVEWHEPPTSEFSPLAVSGARKSSLDYRAIELPGGPPLFAKDKKRKGAHSIAYFILDRNTGKRLLVAPDVCGFNDELTEAMRDAAAILFDGTFWSGDELSRVKSGGRTAAEMGHVTIRDHSLAVLGELPAKHKIYIHINNTNPVLCPDSPERAAVEKAGIEIGRDGLEFEI